MISNYTHSPSSVFSYYRSVENPTNYYSHFQWMFRCWFFVSVDIHPKLRLSNQTRFTTGQCTHFTVLSMWCVQNVSLVSDASRLILARRINRFIRLPRVYLCRLDRIKIYIYTYTYIKCRRLVRPWHGKSVNGWLLWVGYSNKKYTRKYRFCR